MQDDNRTTAKCFFIDGPGGTGKTYLLNVFIRFTSNSTYIKIYNILFFKLIYHRLAGFNYNVIATAFTGIAAALLVGGGRTLHSRFKLPIPTELGNTSNMNVESIEAAQIRNAHLFIIDEASMVSRAVLECVDRLLRDITRNRNVPFGGKVVLLTGDFRQCAPISDNNAIETCIQMCLKNSDLWSYFVQLELSENVRADRNELEFKEWAMSVGNDRCRVYDGLNLIKIPDRVICNGNIVNSTFGNGQINPDERQRLNNVILCPTNRDSLEINEVILNRLNGELFEYLSSDEIIERPNRADNDSITPIEQAYERTPQGYPPHLLRLKVGAVVILIRNWSLADGLCNGTRLRVEHCSVNSIRCSTISGPNAGNEYTFCRTMFTPPLNETRLHFNRNQFPFRLAFSMTINKSQGQTFNNVGLLLRTPCFSHGQLYVAISRVRNFDSLKILIETHENGIYRQGELDGYDGGFYTKNVVYREILN